MKEHNIIWYESEDGKIFLDEMDCIIHEAKLLYEKSGVRFYRHDWSEVDFIAENDYAYNECDYVVIDRKNKNSERLVDFVNDNFGWCLLKDAYEMDGDTFSFEDGWKVVPVSSHLVY